MRLYIEPTEPLLFRTGRPFDAGENNFAESIFPPTPETLQGAVRAIIATHWNTAKTLAENFENPALTNLIGNRDSYGRFRLTNIVLARHKGEEAQSDNVEYLYPMPSTILLGEHNKGHQARLIPKERPSTIRTDLSDDTYLLYQKGELDGKPDTRKYWLTSKGLWTALSSKNDIAKNDIVSASTIYTTEPRLGIGMNNKTKATEEGLLYQVLMIRMNHLIGHDFTYGFVVDVRIAQPSDATTTDREQLLDDEQTQKALKLPDQGWLTLGGERRAARFMVLKPSDIEQNESPELPKRGSLLYLATPAAFDRGWRPASWSNWAEPVAVAMERYQPIGGWLLNTENAGGRNKPQRRCVPAGSVYFFNKSVNGSNPFTDYGKEIGYGITFGGEW